MMSQTHFGSACDLQKWESVFLSHYKGRVVIPPTGQISALGRRRYSLQPQEQRLVLRSRAVVPRALKPVSITLVRSEEETIQVALDVYSVLGVNRIASKDTIIKAYDALVMGPSNTKLSEELLCSRAVVLKAATDTLLDTAARHAIDHGGMLDIPRIDLPGAISLLLEASDWSTALEWGQAWLAHNSNDVCAKDVAMCMALAHCDQAAAQMERSGGSALDSASALKSALALLKKYCTGQSLQAEIQETLQELAPKVALQLISAPREESDARNLGMSMLKEVLWKDGSPEASFPTLRMSRSSYFEAICSYLTAAEQVQLFEAAPSTAAAADGEIYSAALAHLAVGFRTYMPAHLKTAARLLASLDTKLEPATGRKRFDALDVSVELAVCKLLLGEVAAAEASLGLGESPSHSADPAVKRFIQSQSGEDSEDLLPGMYMLAQQWMAEVLANRFPELATANLSFDQWFSNPRIALYLQVVDKSRQMHLDGAGSFLLEKAAALPGRCLAVLAAIWRLLVSVLTSPFRALSTRQTTQPEITQQEDVPSIVQALGDSKVEASEEELEGTSGAGSFGTEYVSRPHSSRLTQAALISAPEPDAQGLPTLAAASAASSTYAETVPPFQDSNELPEADDHFTEPKRKVRQQVGVPLSAVTNQTVGEIQQQIQDAMPLEEKDGFSTDHMDAPLPQPLPGHGLHRGSGKATARPLRAPPSLLMLEGEREMWQSYKADRYKLRFTNVILALLFLGAAVWAGLARRGHFSTVEQQVPDVGQTSVMLATATPASTAQTASTPLTTKDAHSVLKLWESVKADALGKQRQVGRLHEVLGGDMLKEALKGARSLKANNMHYEYKMQHLSIAGIEQIGPDRALASARIKEVQQLKDSTTGDTVSADKIVLDQLYELAKVTDRGWRIMGHKAL